MSDPRDTARAAFRAASRIQADARTNALLETPVSAQGLSPTEQRVCDALSLVSPKLATSYSQVKIDIASNDRVSFAGTAHEVRELVATLLRLKAPDAEVVQKKWYKPEVNTTGPTHRQRVKYILEGYNAGSKELEVAQEIGTIDDLVANTIRGLYSRASDAAHRHKEKREVTRLVRYFDAFVEDLLNLS